MCSVFIYLLPRPYVSCDSDLNSHKTKVYPVKVLCLFDFISWLVVGHLTQTKDEVYVKNFTEINWKKTSITGNAKLRVCKYGTYALGRHVGRFLVMVDSVSLVP